VRIKQAPWPVKVRVVPVKITLPDVMVKTLLGGGGV
jgi:hypothetical protein